MTAIVNVSFDVKDVAITFGKARHKVPFYFCLVGRGNKTMSDSRDIFETFTQNENLIFWRMDKAKDVCTNEVLFTSEQSGLCKTSTYPRAVTTLINKGVLLRIKQNHYLLNPNITMPKFEFYQPVLLRWQQLKGK